MSVQDAILIGVILIQVIDTALLFHIMGDVAGYKGRIDALEEWKRDLGRRM